MSENKVAMNRIEILKSYIQEDENDLFSHYALALEYISLEKHDVALIHLKKVNQIDKTYLPCYYQLGKCLERSLQQDEAAKIFQAGISVAKSQNDFKTKNELQSALDLLDVD